MGALEDELVKGPKVQAASKKQLDRALEDRVFKVLETIGAGEIVDKYEEFEKAPVVEMTKRARWPNLEYTITSSDEEEEEAGNNLEEQVYYGMQAVDGEKIKIPSLRSSPQEAAQQIDDLREKAMFLEAALKAKVTEIESLKRNSREKETKLLDKIECLKLANEQLLQAGQDTGTEAQLQMELTRLQKQNSTLAQRERELQFQLSTKEMLQKEVNNLQELNDQLMNNVRSQVNITVVDLEEESSSEKLEERINLLEMELAQAMEVTNMYKSQLQLAFSKQENVQAAALRNMGINVDAVIDELLDLRRLTKTQETELHDLQDRIFLLSIQLAETEASREELRMKLKKQLASKSLKS